MIRSRKVMVMVEIALEKDQLQIRRNALWIILRMNLLDYLKIPLMMKKTLVMVADEENSREVRLRHPRVIRLTYPIETRIVIEHIIICKLVQKMKKTFMLRLLKQLILPRNPKRLKYLVKNKCPMLGRRLVVFYLMERMVGEGLPLMMIQGVRVHRVPEKDHGRTQILLIMQKNMGKNLPQRLLDVHTTQDSKITTNQLGIKKITTS
mmetsp:Transcript_13627/g.22485  ORF Transcript_13627/g.22485 Transcript_13627/m.22485 type:complete len:207 (+) Transcript_13627:2450-3070(+)